MDIKRRRKISRRNGATILLYHDKKAEPHKSDDFRNIIEAKWLPVTTDMATHEIPCILGASYGVNKSWYQYIDGFCGHKSWGTLEPYISLKSWLFGGNCLTAPLIETGHIFKQEGTHNPPLHHLIYNKMFVATVLFDDSLKDRLIAFLGRNITVDKARKEYELDYQYICTKKEEYRSKIVIDPIEFFNRWDIDLRLND